MSVQDTYEENEDEKANYSIFVFRNTLSSVDRKENRSEIFNKQQFQFLNKCRLKIVCTTFLSSKVNDEAEC